MRRCRDSRRRVALVVKFPAPPPVVIGAEWGSRERASPPAFTASLIPISAWPLSLPRITPPAFGWMADGKSILHRGWKRFFGVRPASRLRRSRLQFRFDQRAKSAPEAVLPAPTVPETVLPPGHKFPA